MLNVTINLEGKTQSDIENALGEVTRLLREGYTSGHNSNNTSAYHFDVEGEAVDVECVCNECGQVGTRKDFLGGRKTKLKCPDCESASIHEFETVEA